MKTHIKEIKDYVLLTIDSETPEERRLLHRFSRSGGYLTASGTSGISEDELVERIQFVTGEVTLTLKDDIENLISYASNNDQMDAEEFKHLDQIRVRMKELGLYED